MCPAKCTGGTCQRATGDCNGCKRGFFGSKCRPTCNANCEGGCNSTNGDCTACPNRQYGKFCNMSCSSGCGQCDQDSGNCTACKDNLIFPDCTVCVDKYYKQTAPACIPCPGTCDNDTPCDKTTGHCDECPHGRKGDMCDQACDGGQYGPSRCSLSCGQCDDRQQCHPVTGQCPLCEPEFYHNLARWKVVPIHRFNLHTTGT
ncbi:scavenger receptor class F member 1-like [Littorina saxatilis]|uniref:scavenger receptor class F member 1-like n=1 Tax=Littorina saxatilis TaxID=31220 RepID=UPI0038B4A564